MKIRTNFVTNSSSYSSAEIKIDNPVLLEILEKYSKKGAFKVTNGWGDVFDGDFGVGMSQSDIIDTFGTNYTEWELGEEKGWDNIEWDKTSMAFWFRDEEQAEISFAPDSIEGVAMCILDVIVGENRDIVNRELFEECVKELKERADEINDNYIEVFWEARDESYGEELTFYEDEDPDDYEPPSWEFYYKKSE